jgi:cytochrome c556
MTRAMMDAAAISLKATEARDVEALLNSGEAVNASCDTCHMKYQTP